MIISMKLDEFDISNLIINEKIKNKVLNSSDFYRLIYSDEHSSISGIFLIFSFENINLEKYFNKIKCTIAKSESNNKTIEILKNIEKNIMAKYKNKTNKQPIYRVNEQLQQYFIKLYGNDSLELKKYKKINFLLKISGIWDSDETKDFGLTFRFFIFNNLFEDVPKSHIFGQ